MSARAAASPALRAPTVSFLLLVADNLPSDKADQAMLPRGELSRQVRRVIGYRPKQWTEQGRCVHVPQLPAQGCGQAAERRTSEDAGCQSGATPSRQQQHASAGRQAGWRCSALACHAFHQQDACSRPRYRQLLLQDPAGCLLLRAAYACPLKVAAALLPSRCDSNVA